jgi:murein DD-endopeptidase MepM/ murein hydrolase activator NlpD
MRVSTAVFYTIAALIAKDLTSQTIATASAVESAVPTPSEATAAEDIVAETTLVEPIAPAEAIPVQPAWVSEVSNVQAETVVSLAPVPQVIIPEALKPPVEASAAATTPSASTPIAPAASSSAVPEATAVTPPTSEQSNTQNNEQNSATSPLFEQTVNEAELLTKFRQPNANQTFRPNTPINALTDIEIKRFQQAAADSQAADNQAKNPTTSATAANDTEKPGSALVSPNLAENAEAAFGNNQPVAPAQNPECTEAQSATTASNPACVAPETATNQLPNAPEAVAVDNSGFSYSVQPIQPSSNARNYYNLSTRPSAMLGNGNVSLMFPLSIPAAITSAFGWRVHPVMGTVRFHSGTDIGAPQGTPVLAAFDGEVEIADFLGGYGLTVVLNHNNATEKTLYAHLSELFVQPGTTVKQGEVIGRVGSTGLSTGPHLHFEFRKLTQEGWTVVDAGPTLEYALARLLQSPQTAQANSKPNLPPVFQYSGKFLNEIQVIAQASTQPVNQLNQVSPVNQVNQVNPVNPVNPLPIEPRPN